MSRLFRTNELLKEKILEWYPNPGTYSTSIPGFIIARRDAPSDFNLRFPQPKAQKANYGGLDAQKRFNSTNSYKQDSAILEGAGGNYCMIKKSRKSKN